MGTVSYRGVSNAAAQTNGNVGTSTVNVTPTAPTGLATTDRVFIVSACTHSNLVCSDPNWKGGTVFTIGSGAVGAGAGMRFLAIWWRDYDGVWSMPTIGLGAGASNASHSCAAIALSKATTDSWLDPAFSTVGNDFGTANVSYDAITGPLTTQAGSMTIAATVQNDNVTMSNGSFSGTGASWISVIERADGGTATGNDVALQVFTGATFGPGTGTVYMAGTLSASSQGGTLALDQATAAATGVLAASTKKVTADFRAPTPPLSTLSWDFTSSSPAWDVSAAPDFAVSGGQGVFSGLDGSNAINQISSVSAYDLTSSYAEIQVVQAGSHANLSVILQLLLGSDINGISWLISVGTALAMNSAGDIVGSRTHTDGDWYRISESGGTISYEYGTDGTSWTTLGTSSVGALPLTDTHALFGIFALGTVSPDQTVVIDNFNPLPSGAAGGIASSTVKTSASFGGTQGATTATMSSTVQKASASLTGQQPGSGAIASSTKKTIALLIDAQAETGVMSASTIKASASMLGSPLAKAETLNDDFNTGSVPDSAKWIFDTATISGGLLHITQSAVTSKNEFDLRGSYAMTELVDVGGGITTALLMVWTTGWGGSWEGFYYLNDVLYHYSTTDGILASIPYDSTSHRWLRVTVNTAGTTFTTETSPNGITWTTLFAHTGGTQAFHGVQLELLGDTSTGSGEIAWNSFNVIASTAGTLTAALAKTSASLTGTQAQLGTMASVLPKTTAAFGGAMAQPGTLTSTTRKVLAALGGVQDPLGIISSTLRRIIFSSSGIQTTGLPNFHVVGTLKIIGIGLTEEVPRDVIITFTSNIPGRTLIRWRGKSYRIPPVIGTVDAGGNIVNDEGGPLLLLAQSSELNVHELQWQVAITVPGTVIPPKRALALHSWWIQAGGNGDTINFTNALPDTAVHDIESWQ